MSGKHTLIIVGHLGKDPEMRYTANGVAVTTFSVATSRTYTKDSQKVEETTWFRVTTWKNLAESCNTYLHKGNLVEVEGRLTPGDGGGPEIWIGEKDGKPHANYEVTAEQVTFLTPPEKGGREQLPAVTANPDDEIWKE
jgi:single-strand DNA-binding protein